MKSEMSRKCTPPGLSCRAEIYICFVLLSIMTIKSLFFPRVLHQNIHWIDEETYIGLSDIMKKQCFLPDFEEITSGSFGMMIPIALLCIYMIIRNYLYFYGKGNVSYLMKRVPDRWELHKRCLTYPLAIILTGMVLCILLFLYFVIIYRTSIRSCPSGYRTLIDGHSPRAISLNTFKPLHIKLWRLFIL